MKLALLCDIHSNLEALEAVIRDARDWGAQLYLVAGDIVGYGASPNECIGLVRKLDANCIAGNHEWGVIEKTSTEYFNSLAQEAILWTRENLSDESRAWIESLPLTLDFKDISLAHANFLTPESWDYVFTYYQAKAQFQGFSTQIGVIGHSHMPFIVRRSEEEGQLDQCRKESVKWDKEWRFLVNAGSVGQPRDGDPRASYLQVDLEAKMLSLKRVSYDVALAQRRIVEAGLPGFLAERLAVGR